MLTFELQGRNIALLKFKTERIAESPLRASWFWSTSARFAGTWRIFSSPGDSKLTPDGLGFQWKGQSKTFWTRTFELLGRSIANLYFKTERLTESALRASWLWPNSARSGGTWQIFSSPKDSKLTPDGLALQWNGHSKAFRMRTFEPLGRNIAQLDFKTERVAGTALRASWFWPTWARFPGTGGIFSTFASSKLTPDGLGLQWNGHSKTFWTLTFELVGRNTATLYFKTETVTETALHVSWFWSTSAQFPGTWEIFSSPGDSKLTPACLGLEWNWNSKTFWTLTFQLLGPKVLPHFILRLKE